MEEKDKEEREGLTTRNLTFFLMMTSFLDEIGNFTVLILAAAAATIFSKCSKQGGEVKL